MSDDNVTKFVPNLDKLTSRIVLYHHDIEVGLLCTTDRFKQDPEAVISDAMEMLRGFQDDIRAARDTDDKESQA